jgi:uncharacterized protein YdhG (YjbR/CyaY superfamily)
MKRKPRDIDDYLASVTGDRLGALEKLRAAIHRIVPRAEECISYGVPAFRFEGEVIAGFAATTRGCSYFPFSGSTLRTLGKDLEGYRGTKGSLHFDPKKGLPVALVRKLLRARIREL